MALLLLAAGAAGTVAPPWRGRRWLVPAALALVALAAGLVDDPAATVEPLAGPVGFLLAAVPFALLLEHAGFFDALAGRLSGGPGRLWVLGALVTTLLNLDTAVVLLTPLYARLDRRLAVQPVLLALVASSALPVSNLTNLVAGISTADALVHLGPPSLVATAVAWLVLRRTPSPARVPVPAAPLDPVVAAVVVAVVAGFVLGRAVHVEPWAVALAGTLALAARTRRLPWSAVPLGTGAAVLALGVLAAVAAADLDLSRLARADAPAEVVLAALGTALAANVVNNLPATLVVVGGVGADDPGIWPALLGLNVGPFLAVTGSLASLLWLESTRRLGLDTTAADFTRLAVRVVGPAFAAAVATMALLSA